MLNNQVPKSKPQGSLRPSTQGKTADANSNSTTLKDSRSRYDKGMEIYRASRVQLTPSGIFKVSERFYVDTEKMQCDCPDYRTRKESCKHLFAAMLFVKNRGKQKIEGLDSNGKNQVNTNVNLKETDDTTVIGSKPEETNRTSTISKPFDRQATITRLAVINSAIELLKTHRTPLEPETVISIAAQLEKWALGN